MSTTHQADPETGEVIEIDADVLPASAIGAPLPVVRPSAPSYTVAPTVQAADLIARLDAIHEAMRNAMQENVDYGKIPGTDKPTLLKPGAEKLSVMFQFDCQTEHAESWGPDDHLTVSAHTTVWHIPSGARVGSGEGMCSTRESKYAHRKLDRTCPTCGKAAVIKGKAEYGGGWLCWRKRDGCGAQWPDGTAEIESQPTGEIANPDLPDVWNTVIKMARKRAIVDAVLLSTGASAVFTQDQEDNTSAEAAAPSRPLGDEYDKPTLGKVVAAACTQIAGGDREQGRQLFVRVGKDCDGYMPAAAAIALMTAAEAVALTRDPAAPDPT